MRRIELIKGVQSSVLGFGCAPILGSIDGKKARRALECALDNGINHFDLARSYGYGDAERFVGNVMKGRRDKIVLASKFGIRANWKADLFKPLKPLVRFAQIRWKNNSHFKTPTDINTVVNFADIFHERVLLSSGEMRKSLEQSLRALRTDYLDYFFLHEPQTKLIHIDEIAATAELLKSEGKIRAWGLAYNRIQEDVHKDYLNCFDILQFNISPGAFDYDTKVQDRGLYSNIIFSPLLGNTINMSPREKLQKLLKDFSHSVVLCSMYNENHLLENIRSVS